MLTYLAHAEGSVSSSIIIDGSELSPNPRDIIPVLHRIHADIDDSRHPHGMITKFVVIRPSVHPMYDLSYWFFQLIPGKPVTFDFSGTCGHSILAAIQVAMKWGWVSSASPGLRVRVFVENVGDSLVCEVDHAARSGMNCTAHFIENQGISLGSLLPTGQAKNRFQTSFGEVEASIVSSGNAYVFVHAESLSIYSEAELFLAGSTTLGQLQEIRRAAAVHLELNPEHVFPKNSCRRQFTSQTLCPSERSRFHRGIRPLR